MDTNSQSNAPILLNKKLSSREYHSSACPIYLLIIVN
jgi:hypothetical protein